MNRQEAIYIYEMIQSVILDQPIKKDETFKDDEYVKELEELLLYFSSCMKQRNQIVHEFSKGNFDVEFSYKDNLLTGQLKQLQSVFKHLTWQTKQIAQGDYQQKISMLGEFSKAFNTMTTQLYEREIALLKNAESKSQYSNLLKSIIQINQDWIIVTGKYCQEILYSNRSYIGCDLKKDHLNPCNDATCEIIQRIKNTKVNGNIHEQEFMCEGSHLYFNIVSYPVEWEDKDSYVHYISDCTKSKMEEKQLYGYAYTDELTNVYNRRYAYKMIGEYIENHQPFSLVLIDLDGLKTINDQLGHSYGDIYLRDVVHTLRQIMEDEEVLCRVGGDEFILLSLIKNEEEMKVMMLKAIDWLKLNYPDKHYSFSFGVSYSDGVIECTDDDLIKKADHLMYEYKKVFKPKDTSQK